MSMINVELKMKKSFITSGPDMESSNYHIWPNKRNCSCKRLLSSWLIGGLHYIKSIWSAVQVHYRQVLILTVCKLK